MLFTLLPYCITYGFRYTNEDVKKLIDQSLIKESSEDLLQLMQWKKELGYEEAAKQAFVILCDRFQQPLLLKCEIIADKKGLSEVDAIEVVENTFKRIYKYGHNFDPSRNKNFDQGFKYYLYGIANRECTKLLCKKLGIGVSPYTGDEEIITEIPEITEDLVPDQFNRNQLIKEQEILDIALKRYSWKHKVIYLTYKFHQRKGHKMPRALLLDLRDMLGLGQGTINAYKKEITDTINDYLKIYGKQ